MTAVAVSIVSHGHGSEVLPLLESLASRCAALVRQVILTLNLPDAPLRGAIAARAWPFDIEVLENGRPLGFGANHNRAFAAARQPYFCVLNPDVEILSDPFPALVDAARASGGGLAYPRQLSRAGAPQDGSRRVPTPGDLLNRHLLRRDGAAPGRPEFVTGACMLFDASTYAALRGFDERYFMYCEDVDLCLRIQAAGGRLAPAGVDIVHEAQRASRRRLRPMMWHVASFLRLWASPAYRAFRERFR